MSAPPLDRRQFRMQARLVARREAALTEAQNRLAAARRDAEAAAGDLNRAKEVLREMVERAAGVRLWP